ncbi:Asp-tRNA(Asn)/Glu-tRNA(Gln) amidotransferase subunit GatC [bacterium]|nr:Asp-tRNA(Asn)/Glu-tRNA(Gln) amidotransferase subunit GatC [bacterium]
MSKLSKEELANIATLARLGLSEDELNRLGGQVGSILEFVEQLQKIDASGVKQTSQVTGLVDVWREDEVVRCELSREELLKNAPATEKGYIKVKRVLQ